MKTFEDPDPSLGALVHDLAEAGSNLVHAEVKLAEAKLAQRIQIAGPALVLICVGGAFGFVALLTIMFTLGAWLRLMIGTVGAAATVSALCACLAALFFIAGRNRFIRVFGGTPTKLANIRGRMFNG